MKRTLLTLVLCFSVVLLPAQIHFTKGSWDELKNRAEQEGKGIFVDIYTTWCGPCRKMAATVFTDARAGECINPRYIAVQLDAEKESDHGFFREYTPTAYPTFYWLDSKGRLLDTKTGYMPAEAFIAATHEAGQSTMAAEWAACRKEWDEGNRRPEFVQKYLFGVLPKVGPAQIRPLLNEYLSGLTEEQKAEAGTGRMVLHFTRTIEDDEVFRTLVRHNDDYQRSLGFDETGRTLYTALVRVPMADRRTPGRCEADVAVLRSLDFPSKEMYLQLIDMETQLFDGNYSEGLRRAADITARWGQTYNYLYAEICYTLVISRFFAGDKQPQQEDIQQAEQLARRALELTPSKCTLAYLAAVHALQGNYKKSYELMMHAPFYGEPTLSNAVYPLLQLPSGRELNIN